MTNTEEQNSDPRVIRGVAASPGTVTARARVLRGNSWEVDVSQLQAGEVLVCSTAPWGWRALFSTASAVVADAGGFFSVAAIIARETQIPCVCATERGTSLIKDGQTITVDGDHGIVRIEQDDELEQLASDWHYETNEGALCQAQDAVNLTDDLDGVDCPPCLDELRMRGALGS